MENFLNVVQVQSLGNLAQYPPLGKDITITTGDDGMPQLQPTGG